jgi:hypothetical protein
MAAPRADDDYDVEAVTSKKQDLLNSKVDKLMYEIHEKMTYCNGNIEWTGLEFYEHVLLIRQKVRWCCLPDKYYAEALPRFKIVNVTFTNGRRNLLGSAVLIALIGVFFLTLGLLRGGGGGGGIMIAVIGGILILLAPLPFLLCTKRRHVTFDIRGLSMGRWFSSAKTYTFRFNKEKPDEAFIIDYIFGPLRKGGTAIHALSHINSVGLAFPLNSYAKADFTEKEETLFQLYGVPPKEHGETTRGPPKEHGEMPQTKPVFGGMYDDYGEYYDDYGEVTQTKPTVQSGGVYGHGEEVPRKQPVFQSGGGVYGHGEMPQQQEAVGVHGHGVSHGRSKRTHKESSF